ncbi:MAG: NUDIX domain-containing protein [Candidatus Shapirobacteria bacterium]
MTYKRLPLKEFMAIYHKVPRATVDIVINSKDGILLTKRAIPPFKGMWHIPGGTILFKEPILYAIDRIARDELGIKVEVIKHLGVSECFDDGGRHAVRMSIWPSSRREN